MYKQELLDFIVEKFSRCENYNIHEYDGTRDKKEFKFGSVENFVEFQRSVIYDELNDEDILTYHNLMTFIQSNIFEVMDDEEFIIKRAKGFIFSKKIDGTYKCVLYHGEIITPS